MAAAVEDNRTDFQRHFWGENGFLFLQRKHENETRFFNDVSLCMQKLAAAMDTFGNALQDVGSFVRIPVEYALTDTVHQAWSAFNFRMIENGKAYLRTAQILREECARSTEEEDNMIMPMTANQVKEMFIELNKSKAPVVAAQHEFYRACQEQEELARSTKPAKQGKIEKVEKNKSKSRERYLENISELKKLQPRMTETLRRALKTCQDVYEKRVFRFRDRLGAALAQFGTTSVTVGEDFISLRDGQVAAIDPDANLKILGSTRGTGDTRFEHVVYEPYDATKAIGAMPTDAMLGEDEEDENPEAMARSMESYKSEETIIEGELLKKGHFRRNWLKRWFVVKGRAMFYYKSRDRVGKEPPKGIVRLVDSSTVENAEIKMHRQYCFEVNAGSIIYYLAASTSEGMERWITKLNQIVGKAQSIAIHQQFVEVQTEVQKGKEMNFLAARSHSISKRASSISRAYNPFAMPEPTPGAPVAPRAPSATQSSPIGPPTGAAPLPPKVRPTSLAVAPPKSKPPTPSVPPPSVPPPSSTAAAAPAPTAAAAGAGDRPAKPPLPPQAKGGRSMSVYNPFLDPSVTTLEIPASGGPAATGTAPAASPTDRENKRRSVTEMPPPSGPPPGFDPNAKRKSISATTELVASGIPKGFDPTQKRPSAPNAGAPSTGGSELLLPGQPANFDPTQKRPSQSAINPFAKKDAKVPDVPPPKVPTTVPPTSPPSTPASAANNRPLSPAPVPPPAATPTATPAASAASRAKSPEPTPAAAPTTPAPAVAPAKPPSPPKTEDVAPPKPPKAAEEPKPVKPEDPAPAPVSPVPSPAASAAAESEQSASADTSMFDEDVEEEEINDEDIDSDAEEEEEEEEPAPATQTDTKTATPANAAAPSKPAMPVHASFSAATGASMGRAAAMASKYATISAGEFAKRKLGSNYQISTSGSISENPKLAAFFKSTAVPDILSAFNVLCTDAGIDMSMERDHLTVYPTLKSNLMSWKMKELWALLDARASQSVYEGLPASETRVLIVGAGPAGLRAAVECALLGAKVLVIEKRTDFTRNNVLHLWPFAVTDLRSLGAKFFYGKFCTGGLLHISIKKLQTVLLKVALMLGVQFRTGYTFVTAHAPPEDGMGLWTAEIEPANAEISDFEFDVLIGAEGSATTIDGFTRTVFRANQALGVTANFENKHTRDEANVEEISGRSLIYHQDFFAGLKNQYNIELENIVYYQDETHYFVFTVKKTSLLAKGVLRRDITEAGMLLQPDNIDRGLLAQLAKEVAAYAAKLPHYDWALNNRGNPDVDIFDFTKIRATTTATKIYEVAGGRRLLLALVGDSLLEPFWPTGTGANRAILSALDTAWMVRGLYTTQPQQLLQERENVYHLLAQTDHHSLKSSYDKFTIDPMTRYPHIPDGPVDTSEMYIQL